MDSNIILIMCSSLFVCTLIDVVGSILSRRFEFNYEYFSILSFLNYFTAGYFLATLTAGNWVLIYCALIGLYDVIIGLKISQKLRANVKIKDFDKVKLNFNIVITLMALTGLTGYLGSLLGLYFK